MFRNLGEHLIDAEVVERNTTQSERVVIPVAGNGPIEGYALVIFESNKQSRVLYDAHRDYKPWWQRLISGSKLEAYAVNMRPHQQYGFFEYVTHEKGVYNFELEISIEFEVENPDLIATRLNEDPLTLLRNYVAEILKTAFSRSPWTRIVNDFERLTGELLGGGVLLTKNSRLENIRQFARKLGLHVLTVNVSRNLELEDKESNRVQKVEEIELDKFTIKHRRITREEDLKNDRARTLEIENKDHRKVILRKDHDLHRTSLAESHEDQKVEKKNQAEMAEIEEAERKLQTMRSHERRMEEIENRTRRREAIAEAARVQKVKRIKEERESIHDEIELRRLQAEQRAYLQQQELNQRLMVGIVDSSLLAINRLAGHVENGEDFTRAANAVIQTFQGLQRAQSMKLCNDFSNSLGKDTWPHEVDEKDPFGLLLSKIRNALSMETGLENVQKNKLENLLITMATARSQGNSEQFEVCQKDLIKWIQSDASTIGHDLLKLLRSFCTRETPTRTFQGGGEND